MRGKVYARVSTEDQHVNQMAEYTKNFYLKLGHEITRVIKDEESGTLPLTERKKFKRLLEESLLDGTEFIAVQNLERLTRNWDDVVFVERYFRENQGKINLFSTADAPDLSNASGRMLFRIRMAVSCFMPEDMREKQEVGIARAKAEGKYKGGKKGRKWCKNAV
ncbi:MAG: recombinase family protein [Bacteroidetes bacterium]|nr:recombinase family protein [Bacteroidota bacterium]